MSQHEKHLVALVLNNRAACLKAAEITSGSEFADSRYGRIFDKCVRMYNDGLPVDMLAVSDALKVDGHDETNALIEVTSPDVEAFRTDLLEARAKAVREAYIRRAIQGGLTEIVMLASDPSQKITDIRSRAESVIFGLRRHGSLEGVVDMGEAVARVLGRVEAAQRLAQEGKHLGVPSGFRKLDAITLGWQKTDFIIIAARPSVGKSAFMGEVIMNGGVPTLVFSLEMSALQLAERIVLPEAGVDRYQAMRGRTSDADWANLATAAGRVGSMPIFVDERGGLTIDEIRSVARLMHAKHNIGLVAVDYVQLAAADVGNRNREQEMAAVSRGLKNMAKELDIPVIGLAQLNRIEATQRPDLSNLRECLPVDEWVDTPTGPVMIGSRPKQVACYVNGIGAEPSSCTYIEKRYNKVKTIKTDVGEIRATPRHLIMTGLGWKQARKIVPGDIVAVPNRLPVKNGPSVERPYLLGMLLGNGGLSGTPALCFRKECQGRVEEELRGLDVSITYRKAQKSDNIYDTYISRDAGTGQENDIMAWIRSLGLEGSTCYDKFIPESYMVAPERDRISLLQGLWDSDGTVTHGTAKYATVSEVMARQVKWLLHSVGILSSVNYYSDIWEVRVLNRCNREMRRICTTPGRYGKLSMPSSRYIDPCPQLLMSMIDHLGKAASRIQKREDGGYKEFAKWAVIDSMKLHPLADLMATPYYSMEGVSWIKVSAVEDGSKEVRVCDLNVPIFHNFFASGVMVHNSGSFEQDADVVCFIWREPDLLNGNKSPIINVGIDKHRNGALGSLKLTYMPGSARLKEYAEVYDGF